MSTGYDKPEGFQLSPITLNHIEFIDGLFRSGVYTEDQAVEEVANAIREMPAPVRKVLLPLNRDVYRIITDHLSHGARKIAVYKDGTGKRYMAADIEGRDSTENNSSHKKPK